MNNLEPSYKHQDSDWILTLVLSTVGLCLLGYIFEAMYKDGIDKVLSATFMEILVGFSAIIGWFFLTLNSFSSTFPIYINSNGGHYRSLFLRRKNLKWGDVREIIIAKQKKNGKLQYYMIVCSKKPSLMVWSIETFKSDDHSKVYQVIDYYVQKYKIKVTLQNRLNNTSQALDEMPKALDFSSKRSVL